jgi:hypothetical protein
MAGAGTADVLITGDQGSVTTDLITTNGACMPVYGVAHITSALQKQVLTEDLNLVGAICDKFSPRGDQYIQGGFGIQAGASNGATGWGTVTGTATHSSTPTVTLHLKGPITQ